MKNLRTVVFNISKTMENYPNGFIKYKLGQKLTVGYNLINEDYEEVKYYLLVIRVAFGPIN